MTHSGNGDWQEGGMGNFFPFFLLSVRHGILCLMIYFSGKGVSNLSDV